MPTKKTASSKPAAPAVSKSVTAALPAVKTTAAPKRSISTKPAIREKKAAESASTVITVHIDVGFGNTLFIRGDGPGLSWEKGIELDCVADNQWTICIQNAVRPIAF